MRVRGTKINRNASCPCGSGSGKKFRYCCTNKEIEESRKDRQYLENVTKAEKDMRNSAALLLCNEPFPIARNTNDRILSPAPKERRAHSHFRCAFFDGYFKIVRHSHGQNRQFDPQFSI